MVTELQPLIDLESWLQSSACGLPSEPEVRRFRLKGKQPVSAFAPGVRVSKTSTAKNSGTKVLKQHTKSEVKRKSCKSGPLCDWRLRPRRPELWLHHTYPAEFPKCLLMDATDEMGISLLSSLARFGDAAPNGDQIVITYATICSGSDIINAALSNLAKAIYEKFKVRVTFEHLRACEFSEPKRKWIAENYNVDMIFTDVCKLMDEAGCREHRSGQLKKPTSKTLRHDSRNELQGCFSHEFLANVFSRLRGGGERHHRQHFLRSEDCRRKLEANLYMCWKMFLDCKTTSSARLDNHRRDSTPTLLLSATASVH